MIDSLITEMPVYGEGWLLALDTGQYIKLVFMLIILVSGWWITRVSQLSAKFTDVKRILMSTLFWAVRVALLVTLSLWTLSVLGLNLSEFF
jgi:hypothetical protein